MSTKTNFKNLKERVLAFIKGDDAELKSLKIQRQSDSAFQVQIAQAKGDLIGKEDAVVRAKEALEEAFVNSGEEIIDSTAYIRRIFEAREVLIRAEEALEAHHAKQEFLEETYKTIVLGE